MTRVVLSVLLASAWLIGGCAAGGGQSDDRLAFVRMVTSAGDIVLELDRERAPITTENFLAYTDRGAYDGTIFHRVITTFVVQGGGHLPDLTELPGGAPIANEWTNGLKNMRGTIAMARETHPDSATRQFYINVADNTRLDRAREVSGNAGYAVFGRVVAGMDVVDRIKDAPTTTRMAKEEMKDVPVDPVVIRRVGRIGAPAGARAGRAAYPPPRPDPGVEAWMGKDRAGAVARAARVRSFRHGADGSVRQGPILTAEQTARLKEVVLSDRSTLPDQHKRCVFHADVDFAFEDLSGVEVLRVTVCFTCDQWRITPTAGANPVDCDPARAALLSLARTLFHEDAALDALGTPGEASR